MKNLLQILFLLFLNIIFGQTSNLELSDVALTLTEHNVVYDSSYFSINYPNGDIPSIKGVCTDVIIRTYRKIGIDLQKEVHQDMISNFNSYPKIWRLKSIDNKIRMLAMTTVNTGFGAKSKLILYKH